MEMYGKYAYIMLFAKSAEKRLKIFKKINSSVLSDQNLVRSLQYGVFSLWACEQQLLWERIRASSAPKWIFSSLVVWGGRGVAYISLAWFVVRMRISGSHVAVYGIDLADPPYVADGRIGGIYRFLEDAKIGYGEILHTVFTKRFFINMIRRRRSAFYLDLAYGAHPASGGVQMSFNSVTVGRIRAATHLPQSIAFIRRILRLAGVRIILAIDDTRYYHPLMIAAKECGIPFYAFQHGRFSKYLPGWAHYGLDPITCPFPDAVFVWSDYWRSVLLETSPVARLYADRVRVGGNPSGSYAPITLTPPPDDGILTFLIPHEDDASEAEVGGFIADILSIPDTHVIYKLRRGRPTPLFTKELVDNTSFEVCFDVGEDEWVRTDAVLGSYSTFLYEAVAFGRPVGVFESGSAQASDLVRGGFAATVRKKNILSDARGIAATSWDEVCRRRRIFNPSGSLEKTLSAIISL